MQFIESQVPCRVSETGPHSKNPVVRSWRLYSGILGEESSASSFLKPGAAFSSITGNKNHRTGIYLSQEPAMKSAFVVGLLSFACLIVSVVPATAANPNDLDFKLRFTREPAVYHIGEPIEFELLYTSETEHKYLTAAANPVPEYGGVKVQLSPLKGVIDPHSLGPCWGGWGGSFIGSGPQYLGPQPITSHAELTNWFHFQKSGHYSLTVTSTAVSRTKTAEEGGGQETLTLESNTVEFDILPHDPVWESEELHAILEALENAKYPGDQYIALHRLALLDTPDSARKLVELYLTTSPSSPEQSNYVVGFMAAPECALDSLARSCRGASGILATVR
jgi:hypothetical protein